MKKIIGILGVAFILTTMFFTTNSANEIVTDDLSLQNLIALQQAQAQSESGGGSTELVCYNSYNTCWFWNCWHAYRCGIPYCTDVQIDWVSDKGKCVKQP